MIRGCSRVPPLLKGVMKFVSSAKADSALLLLPSQHLRAGLMNGVASRLGLLFPTLCHATEFQTVHQRNGDFVNFGVVGA
jgi:hypothetical protein